MTRRSFLLPLLLAGFALTGCGTHQAAQTSPGAPAGQAAAPFKVALLTTGPVNDGGWNESAYNGLLRIQSDLKAQIAKQENLTPAQFREAFQDFASQRYAIIFAHGDEFGPDAAAVAAQFPKTVFITTGGDEKPAPNLAPILFATGEGTYLQGMEAALVSRTGKGGFVGAQDLPPVKLAADAFARGAQAINPKFQFKEVYIGGQNPWNDPAGAKGATLALLNSGADVIAHNCDASSAGMFQTVNGKPGVYAFGVNANENDKAPNVLSSAVLDIPKAFDDIARSVKDGTFKGQALSLGLKDGDVRLVDNPKLISVIPASGRAKVRQAEKDIISGKLKIAG